MTLTRDCNSGLGTAPVRQGEYSRLSCSGHHRVILEIEVSFTKSKIIQSIPYDFEAIQHYEKACPLYPLPGGEISQQFQVDCRENLPISAC